MLTTQVIANPGNSPSRESLAERTWFNAIWFQSFWFVCVLGREHWLPLAFALFALHLWLTTRWLTELRHVLPVAAVGISADALLSLAGVYQFEHGVVVPLWLCLLWLGFAAALPRSLGFLLNRPWLAVACGVIAFPLNYYAGARLGAVEYPLPLVTTIAAQCLMWAVLLPALCLGSRRDEGGQP